MTGRRRKSTFTIPFTGATPPKGCLRQLKRLKAKAKPDGGALDKINGLWTMKSQLLTQHQHQPPLPNQPIRLYLHSPRASSLSNQQHPNPLPRRDLPGRASPTKSRTHCAVFSNRIHSRGYYIISRPRRQRRHGLPCFLLLRNLQRSPPKIEAATLGRN